MNSRMFLYLAALVLIPASLSAQATCNHCGEPPECPLFQHWDNCAKMGPVLKWYGGCSAGCKQLDCSVHFGEPCPPGGGNGDGCPDPDVECNGFARSPIDPQPLGLRAIPVQLPAAGTNLVEAAASSAMHLSLGQDLDVVYLSSDPGEELSGQVPVGPDGASRIQAILGLPARMP